MGGEKKAETEPGRFLFQVEYPPFLDEGPDRRDEEDRQAGHGNAPFAREYRITSYNVCYTKLLRTDFAAYGFLDDTVYRTRTGYALFEYLTQVLNEHFPA